ncbi:MAG TPA: rhomboid family intramembrane serine protease [Streptosporangiaceae bacterium]|nr:rhomboid family intramembrane serine protease [Streptosporangiaceae bacterium]
MAIPLYDSQPTRRVPIVTYTLIALNVAVFLITPMSVLTHRSDVGEERVCAQVTFTRQFGAIPKELTSDRQLALPDEIVRVCHPEPRAKTPWLSVLTAMFLHANWVHLAGNMLFLFIFGAATEDRLGRWRYLLFYLTCGYVAAYGFALTYADSITPMIGASGAIAGVLGSHLVMYPRSRVITLVLSVVPFRLPAWVVLGQFFALQWVSLEAQAQSGTAYVAHIYGFVAGMAIGLVVRRAGGTRRAAVLSAR